MELPEDLHEQYVDLIKKLSEEQLRYIRDDITYRLKMARTKVNVKYTDGNGNYWDGKGRKPRWFIEAMKQGHAVVEFSAE